MALLLLIINLLLYYRTKPKQMLCLSTWRETEAYFYMGANFLLLGRRGRAEEYFRAALELGLKNFYEYTAAKIELGRMESRK